MKNRAHHEGISGVRRCSPYEATFGVKAKVGLVAFLAEAVVNLRLMKNLKL